jgi:NADPH2:quinone reductase
MKALELNGFSGIESVALVDAEVPKPSPDEILIHIKSAGMNFAELELIRGKYPAAKPLPYVLGFEAAGIVVDMGSNVKNVRIGQRVAAVVSSGGYAEYAVANAAVAFPIPDGVSFAEATSISIQGLTAYLLLTLAARVQPHDSVLIQAAAGGVGTLLVQLAKVLGAKQVIGLVSSDERLELISQLGADLALNYSEAAWVDRVRTATGGNGVDVVLEHMSGLVGDECFRLLAPFGRLVLFGAKNIHDTFPPQKIEQLIRKNQTVTGFNLPSVRPEQISESLPPLLALITQHKLKLIARHSFALDDYREAFAALSNRHTVGKVVLVP